MAEKSGWQFSAQSMQYAGGAVDDLFSVGAYKSRAKGYDLEAQSYAEAAAMADKQGDFTRMSTAIKDMQLQRQTLGLIGGQASDVASAGFQAAGSALDIMRDAAQQGALGQAAAHYQGLITEEGYRTQAQSLRRQGEAARMAADQSRKSAKYAYVKAGIKTAAAVAAAMV